MFCSPGSGWLKDSSGIQLLYTEAVDRAGAGKLELTGPGSCSLDCPAANLTAAATLGAATALQAGPHFSLTGWRHEFQVSSNFQQGDTDLSFGSRCGSLPTRSHLLRCSWSAGAGRGSAPPSSPTPAPAPPRPPSPARRPGSGVGGQQGTQHECLASHPAQLKSLACQRIQQASHRA